jgi:hypothetical protein
LVKSKLEPHLIFESEFETGTRLSVSSKGPKSNGNRDSGILRIITGSSILFYFILNEPKN